MQGQDDPVRFYFDEDLSGLANIICSVRTDCTFPGDPGHRIRKIVRPPCIITSKGLKDREWIPIAAAQGWVVVTRDNNILDHVSLLEAVKEHGLKLVTLDSDDGKEKWGQLEVFMNQWRRLDVLHQRRGPVIVALSRTGFREINIDARLEELRGLRVRQRKPRKRRPDSYGEPQTLF